MDLDRYFGKTPATLEEIRRRVMFALDRHPLCRGIEFDVVSMPRNRKNNWTVTLQSIAARRPVGGVRYRGRHPGSLRTGRQRPDSGLFRDDFPRFLIALRLGSACVTPQLSSSFRQRDQTSAGMETFLTKTMTIVALICFLVVGAAATAILGRDSVPACRAARTGVASDSAVQAPVSNKANKKDRLAVVSYALAAYEPPQTDRGAERAVAPGLCLDCARRYRHAEGSCTCRAQRRRRARRSPRLSPSRSRRRTTRCSATSRSPESRTA